MERRVDFLERSVEEAKEDRKTLHARVTALAIRLAWLTGGAAAVGGAAGTILAKML